MASDTKVWDLGGECPACTLLLRRIEVLHNNTEAAMRDNVRMKTAERQLEASLSRETALRRELGDLRNANRELLCLRDLRRNIREAIKTYDSSDTDDEWDGEGT